MFCTVYPKHGLYHTVLIKVVLACQSMEDVSETASLGEASSSQVKRRRPITDLQRKDLRVHKQILIQKNGTWSTSELIDFFYKKYERVLHKSSISESLSDRFNHLDKEDYVAKPDSKKRFEPKWLDLEAALFDWQQRSLTAKMVITDNTLKEMAEKLFYRLPQYQNVEPPQFSKYWLKNYKGRYKVDDYAHHGRSNIMNRLAAETDFADLRQTLKSYDSEDIYSMDETALFWKLSPDDNLIGRERVKAQITVMLACNIAGTQKLPPWVIGKCRTPRCLARSGVYMKNLPIIWRHNGSALMTGLLFEEYIQWFDRQMAGRKVCLLVDELPTHVTGAEILRSESPVGLENTRLILFPTNTPSIRQPLEQGITRSWKVHYRRKWLTYMCDEYDAHRDPLRSTNILKAIHWLVDAWENDVTRTSIQNGWYKSGLLTPEYGPLDEGWKNDLYEDNQVLIDTKFRMTRQIQSLVQQKRIRSAMEVATFISPADEVIDDDDEDPYESILETYSFGGAERDHETDEEDVTVELVKESEALDLLSRLRLYEEQQEDGDKMVISRLNEYEKGIRARLAA